MTTVPVPRSSGFLVTLAVLLALLHAILGVTASVDKSMTADEIGHITGGHAYNTLGDFRLQPENGNLPQRWSALPALLIRSPLPSVASNDWNNADVWKFGHSYFFGGSEPAGELLFSGRAMIAFFSAATGLLVFGWSRALFGWRGAFLSLILFTFCPSFLSHGALATSDVTMAFFFLAAIGAWWGHLEQPGLGRALLSALTLGLACVAKFSAVLLLPMFGLLALIWLTGQIRTQGWRPPLVRLVGTTIMHLSVAWAVIWLFYDSRFSAFAPNLASSAKFYRGDWNWILEDIGWLGPVVTKLRDWHALPEAFLYGFTFVVQFARERSAFLNGEFSVTGWPVFFPFSFLVKTTIPLLLLLCCAAVDWLRRLVRGGSTKREVVLTSLRRTAPLLVLFTVYWGFSITSHLNIGHRHLLPIYPVVFVLLGALGPWIASARPAALIAVAGLSLWHIGESVLVRPHYLAYFNEFVGGPRNGWRHLVDSSLDWGQDLPGLRRWLDDNARGETIYLSYFGTGDPAYEGINATKLPCVPDAGPDRPSTTLGPGIYAISATMLSHVYSPARGHWNAAMEREYQTLRALVKHPQSEPDHKIWKRYELLRFARLCNYLRARPAEAMVGYSILIFRLSQAEIDATVNGRAGELGAAIERVLASP